MAKAFCTQCQSNCYLKEFDDEDRNEYYEYCPNCGSDQFLEPFKESFVPVVKVPLVNNIDTPFDNKEWLDKKLNRDLLELEAKAAYDTVLAEHGPEAAESMYNRIINNES